MFNSPSRSEHTSRRPTTCDSLLTGTYFNGRNAQVDARWLSCGMYVRKGKPPSHTPEIDAGTSTISIRWALARPNTPWELIALRTHIERIQERELASKIAQLPAKQ